MIFPHPVTIREGITAPGREKSLDYAHRLANRDDLRSIVEIYNSAIPGRRSTCDLQPISVAERETWFDASEADRRPIWVGHRVGEPEVVTGYLSFDPFLNGRRGYDVTADIAVYLHPEHRGRGQGGYLLAEAVRHAPTLGVRNLAASIFASNAASIQLFRRHGFERRGFFPGVADLDGVVQDLVFMGRRVP